MWPIVTADIRHTIAQGILICMRARLASMQKFLLSIELNASVACFDRLCETIGLVSHMRNDQGCVAFMCIFKKGYDGESILDMISFEGRFDRPIDWEAI